MKIEKNSLYGQFKNNSNIEILEEFIKHYKEVQEKYKDDEIQAEIERSCYFEEVPAEAIENLIQENKELKEKAKNTMGLIGANYIHKDKVKEKIEEYQTDMKKDKDCKNIFNANNIRQEVVTILQELLEEGE